MAHGWPGGAAAGASALLRTQEVSRRDFPSIGSTFQRSHPSPRALSVACASCARTEKGDGKLRSSARHPRRRRRETLDRWCDRCHGRREPHTRVRRAINHPGAFGGARSEVCSDQRMDLNLAESERERRCAPQERAERRKLRSEPPHHPPRPSPQARAAGLEARSICEWFADAEAGEVCGLRRDGRAARHAFALETRTRQPSL